MSKATQAEAEYTRRPKGGKRCGLCSMFLALSGTCTAVQGKISPLGKCKYWENVLTGRTRPDDDKPH